MSTTDNTSEPEDAPRRNTLGILLWGSLATVAAPTLYIAGCYLAPPRAQPAVAVAGKESEISPTTPRIIKVGATDAIVMRNTQGNLYALSLRCTHSGCTVRWHPDTAIFTCPCHGGRFDSEGTVLKGPPKTPLVRLEVKVETETVIVQGE
jgi:cytochrome b6-f complex iron-sulfur subunit